MVEIQSSREGIKTDLLAYGENDLALKIDDLSDEDLKRLGRFAAKHIGKGGYVSKVVVYGAIEFFEGTFREPKRKRRDMSFYTKTTELKKEGFLFKLLKKLKD